MTNVILNIMPGCFRQGDDQQIIADALTASASDLIVGWDAVLKNYVANYLAPATCKPEWLDYLSQTAGWGDIWDSSWSVQAKRSLLVNNDYIWRTRGSQLILPFLFSVFNLQASITPSTGFILNTTTLPGAMDADPFSYTITVSPSYVSGSPERSLIIRLVRHFLPCWISVTIA